MGKREDFIKQLLEGYETPVDVPATWNELEKLLDPPERNKKPIWLWFALGALLMAVGISAYMMMSVEELMPMVDSSPEKSIKNVELASNTEIETAQIESVPTITTDKTNVEKKKSGIKSIKQKVYESKNTFTPRTENGTGNVLNQAQIAVVSFENNVDANQENVTSTQVRDARLSSQTQNTSSEFAENSNSKFDRLIQLIPVHLLGLIGVKEKTNLFEKEAIFAEISIPQKSIAPVRNKHSNLLTIESGFLNQTDSYLTKNLEENTADVSSFLRVETLGDSASVQQIAGYNFGINFSHTFSNGLILGTGFNYNSFKSKLNGKYERRSDATDTLPSIIVNIPSGAINAAYDTQSFSAVELREITHYNSLNVFQIPFNFGYNIRRGDWQIIPSIGAGLNMIISANGKYFISRSSITEYTEEEPFKQRALLYSLHGELGVHRRIFNDFNLYAGVKAGKYLSDIRRSEISESKFNYLALNLGLSYNF